MNLATQDHYHRFGSDEKTDRGAPSRVYASVEIFEQLTPEETPKQVFQTPSEEYTSSPEPQIQEETLKEVQRLQAKCIEAVSLFDQKYTNILMESGLLDRMPLYHRNHHDQIVVDRLASDNISDLIEKIIQTTEKEHIEESDPVKLFRDLCDISTSLMDMRMRLATIDSESISKDPTHIALQEHTQRLNLISRELVAAVGPKYEAALHASGFADRTTLHDHLSIEGGIVEIAQMISAAERAEPDFIDGALWFKTWLSSTASMPKMQHHMREVAKEIEGLADAAISLIGRKDAGESIWMFDSFSDENMQFLEDLAHNPEYWKSMLMLSALAHDIAKGETVNHFFDHLRKNTERITTSTQTLGSEPKDSQAYKDAKKEFSDRECGISKPLAKLIDNPQIVGQVMPGAAGPRGRELVPYLNAITADPTILAQVVAGTHPEQSTYEEAVRTFWLGDTYDAIGELVMAEKKCIDHHAQDGQKIATSLLMKDGKDIDSLPPGLQMVLGGIGGHHHYTNTQNLFIELLAVADVFNAVTTRDTPTANGTPETDKRKTHAAGLAELMNSLGNQLSLPAVLLFINANRDLIKTLLGEEEQPIAWSFHGGKKANGTKAEKSLWDLAVERSIALDLMLASDTEQLSHQTRDDITQIIFDGMQMILQSEKRAASNDNAFTRDQEKMLLHVSQHARTIRLRTETFDGAIAL